MEILKSMNLILLGGKIVTYSTPPAFNHWLQLFKEGWDLLVSNIALASVSRCWWQSALCLYLCEAGSIWLSGSI